MSVVGYDFGNLNCYIAVARQGGIDILTNDYSLHATPSCIAFGNKSRVMGVAARQQVNTNFKSTALNFKHLLGRKFSDPVTQAWKKFVPCDVLQLPGDTIGIKVNYLNEVRVLTPEQVTAALLVKLKQITETSLGGKVNECVMSVPFFFSDNQRRALLASGKIAGLNVLKIVNDHTAVGIAHGMYHGVKFPPEGQNPMLVAFIDVGHSAVQASIMAFNERKVQVIGAVHDLEVGGIFFDNVIREYFNQKFMEQYKLDARKNPRAWLRLLDESERLKKQMSANSTAIPLQIECFMEDKDVSAKISRAQFEELAAHLFQKIQQLIEKLIDQCGIKVTDISDVELIGGSSRIPYIKQIVASYFNREPKTTLNQDEAVARGAGMQCAIISPSFKVKEFNVKDAHIFEIKLRYDKPSGPQEQVIFSKGDEFPFSKALTLEKSSSFSLEAFYSNAEQIPIPDTFIGRWTIYDVTPTASGEPHKVKVKVHLNRNGVLSIPSASSTEVMCVENSNDVPMAEADQQAPQQETVATPNEDGQQQASNGEAHRDGADEKKEKTKKVTIDYPVQESVAYSLSIDECIKTEKEMQEIDLREKLKADARNALEEYCYNTRDKLTQTFSCFVTPEQAEQFQQLLAETEEWLYDEGEDTSKLEYDDRLCSLRSSIETPIEKRRQELELNEQSDQKQQQQQQQQQEAESMIVEEPADESRNE